MKYLTILLLLPTIAFAQFKDDNVLYKTINWEAFCNQYPAQKNALLLDVRSQGEFDDSSTNPSLNIGHLKGAKHINVTELGARLGEIRDYKNQPVYIYCSHSQRSRRSSKMLADSGFTNVININGGLTDMYLTDQKAVPCKNDLLQTNNGYAQLNPMQVYRILQTMPFTTIIDVRPDSLYEGNTANEKMNAMGRLKGSINIPLKELGVSLDKIPQDKPVLVVDADGNDAASAGALLVSKGYKHVNIAFGGLDEWLQLGGIQKKWTDGLVDRDIPYQTLDAEEFNNLATQNKVTIVDVRPADEFENNSSTAWRNRGHIKGAINIPLNSFSSKYSTIPKAGTVILNSFGNNPEIYAAAALLSKKGYEKVYVLTPGLWGLRYYAFNTPNSMYLNDWVVNVPEENK